MEANGAHEGGRFPGLRVTRAALYTELRGQQLVEKTGFEPAEIAATWALPQARYWFKIPLLDLSWLFRCFHKDPSNDLARPGFTRAGFLAFPGELAELAQLPLKFSTADGKAIGR